jgi:hypothetical protein
MELLGNVGQVDHFGSFGDSVSAGARKVHGLCRIYHRLRNYFGRTRWNCLVKWVMWNLVLVYLEIVLVSVQDRCTVCAECSTGSKIILDAHDGTAR